MLPANHRASTRPMKTTRHLLAPVLLALVLTGPASAEDKTVPESDFNAYKELAQVKLDAAKESLQKDVAALGTRVDNQDKRIDQQGSRFDDISASIDRFGYLQAGFALIFSLISVGAGFLAAMTFSSRAKAEAEQAAEDWFAKNETTLIRRMSNFQKKIDALEAQAAAHEARIQTAASRTYETAEELERLLATIQTAHFDTQQPSASIGQTNNQAIKTEAEQLRHKPEAEYKYNDWNTRAFAAFNAKQREDATYLWRKAASAYDATALEAVSALFAAGTSALSVNRNHDAIDIYSEADEEYQNNPETAARKIVAAALRGKGIALTRLDRFDEAIATFEMIDARYGSDTAPALREQMVRAKNGMGFAMLCRAKASWTVRSGRNADLDAAAKTFEQIEGDFPDKPLILGNRAYCAHLRGEPVEVVRPLLKRALKDGGERLYTATLDDLAIHPVPEDAAFRVLLDEVWAEVRGEDPPGAAPVAG